MPQIVHVVLSKIAPGAPESFTDDWIKRGNAMQGKIPGLSLVKCGTCIEGSKHRTAGFTHMLYSIFDDEPSLRAYANDPTHAELLSFGEGKFTSEKVVFDMEL